MGVMAYYYRTATSGNADSALVHIFLIVYSESMEKPLLVAARPIHCTSLINDISDRLLGLGMKRQASNDNRVQIYRASGGGCVELKIVDHNSPEDGQTFLGFEVADELSLNQISEILAAETDWLEIKETTPTRLSAISSDGVPIRFSVSDEVVLDVGTTPLQIAQMWFSADVAKQSAFLSNLSATPIFPSESEPDYQMNGGGRTVLHTEPNARASAGLIYSGDIEELQRETNQKGYYWPIKQEYWGRYLALTDEGLDGELTWVNEQ